MPTLRLLCPRVGRKSHGASPRMLAEPPGIAKGIPREPWSRNGLRMSRESRAPLPDVPSIRTESRIDETGLTCHFARPGILDNLGLVVALDWQAREFQAQTGIRCQFASNADALDFDPEQSTVIFRVFQETLINIAHHGNPNRVTASLKSETETAVLTVVHNNKGVAKGRFAQANPLDLLGIRERVHHLDGTLDIMGVPGDGTRLTVTIPLHRAARARLTRLS